MLRWNLALRQFLQIIKFGTVGIGFDVRSRPAVGRVTVSRYDNRLLETAG